MLSPPPCGGTCCRPAESASLLLRSPTDGSGNGLCGPGSVFQPSSVRGSFTDLPQFYRDIRGRKNLCNLYIDPERGSGPELRCLSVIKIFGNKNFRTGLCRCLCGKTLLYSFFCLSLVTGLFMYSMRAIRIVTVWLDCN